MVSVVIPTHNRAGLLPEAIGSVLRQTVPDLEVIIVDDASTDDTPVAVTPFLADARLRYERLGQQGGRSAARNHGARLAQGEWLGFLDSDDRYRPDTLQQHLAAASQAPPAGLLLGGYEYVDEDGRPQGDRRPWEEGPLTLSGWVHNCYGMPGSVLVRRSWFAQVGGFDPACEIAEDWDLFLRLAQAGCPMAWVTTLVCQYRQHAGNSTRALSLHLQGSLRALDKLFSQPKLPTVVAEAAPRARAWVFAVFARRAFVAGDDPLGRQYLEQALRLHPPFAGREKLSLLEGLLAQHGREQGPPASSLPARLAPALRVSQSEARQAAARMAMASFFRLHKRAPAEAGRYLRAGVRLDPRWLANRGVLSFIARQALRG